MQQIVSNASAQTVIQKDEAIVLVLKKLIFQIISALCKRMENIYCVGDRKQKSVTWDDAVIDNEFLNRKKSNKCCIYKKPRRWDESDTDDSSSCDEDHAHSHCQHNDHHNHHHSHHHHHSPHDSDHSNGDHHHQHEHQHGQHSHSDQGHGEERKVDNHGHDDENYDNVISSQQGHDNNNSNADGVNSKEISMELKDADNHKTNHKEMKPQKETTNLTNSETETKMAVPETDDVHEQTGNVEAHSNDDDPTVVPYTNQRQDVHVISSK